MDARKVYDVCRRGFVGGWSEGESVVGCEFGSE